jgi:hypothetical protein
LVSKQDPIPGCVFLVGINPATPILPCDLEIDEYISLLLDYERFLSYYRATRRDQGKSPLSRTRTGMDSFIRWLSQSVPDPIIETNVIPYPSPRSKDLKMVPEWVKARARMIFAELLQRLRPRLLLLHGKDTVVETANLLRQERIADIPTNFDSDIRALEDSPGLFHFEWPDGSTCRALACRHFMYYGESGASFSGFRGRVLNAAV